MYCRSTEEVSWSLVYNVIFNVFQGTSFYVLINVIQSILIFTRKQSVLTHSKVGRFTLFFFCIRKPKVRETYRPGTNFLIQFSIPRLLSLKEYSLIKTKRKQN